MKRIIWTACLALAGTLACSGAMAQDMKPEIEGALNAYRATWVKVYQGMGGAFEEAGITTYLRPDTRKEGNNIVAISVDVFDPIRRVPAVPGFGEDRYVVAGLHLREYDCPQKRVRNVQATTLFTYENADYSMLDRNWRRVGERDPDKTPRYYRVLAFDQAEHEVFKRLCPAGSPAAP